VRLILTNLNMKKAYAEKVLKILAMSKKERRNLIRPFGKTFARVQPFITSDSR
jgi:hypothetical protein